MARNRYSLMVVDPNAESLFALIRAISSPELKVHAASTVDQAFTIALKESLDLLVARTWMDTGTGSSLACNLRLIPRHQGLPAIYLSKSQRAGVLQKSVTRTVEYSVRATIGTDTLRLLVDSLLGNPASETTSPQEDQLPNPLIPAPHLPNANHALNTPQR